MKLAISAFAFTLFSIAGFTGNSNDQVSMSSSLEATVNGSSNTSEEEALHCITKCSNGVSYECWLCKRQECPKDDEPELN